MRSKRDLDRQGKNWLMVSGVLMAALFVGVQFAKKVPPDAENCFGRPTRSTVILLDYSDSMASQTRNEIESRAWRWVSDSVQVGERVSIFAMDAEARRRLEPQFTGCKPPNTGVELYENVKKIQREFQERFETPLRAILSRPPGASAESPIAQAVIDLSLSRYLSRGDTVALLVFSDLMENTDAFSLYGCKPGDRPVDSFRRSRRGAQERPSFQGLRVMLNIVPRSDIESSALECRDRFWVWFFGDNSGSTAGVTPLYLPGGGS